MTKNRFLFEISVFSAINLKYLYGTKGGPVIATIK